MRLEVDAKVLEGLNSDLAKSLEGDGKLVERERATRRITLILEGLAKKLMLKGEIKTFGSFSNGFKTGSSDMDVVFLGKDVKEAVPVLRQFADLVPKYGFENITKIFQANVPLVKFTDKKREMEVDFCINNELGSRNSLLLYTYCKYDERVLQLGRLVKEWAKRHELVGTADGCLNSYAYMLLVIHFLQLLEEPVVPNLQAMATESCIVTDMKWGWEDRWETKFFEDVESLPPSENSMTVGELLINFFHYYTKVFDWASHAVCMRLNKLGECVDKSRMSNHAPREQWYVEDPFDLRHNLAGKCSVAGRERILEQMARSCKLVQQAGGWAEACPEPKTEAFFLKCRVSAAVKPEMLLEEFEAFSLNKLHFQKQDPALRLTQVFLEFSTAHGRRRAHTKNESYVQDCQLQLHYSTEHSLAEAVAQGSFSTFEMASYKMKKRVLEARVAGGMDVPAMTPQMGSSSDSRPLRSSPMSYPEGPMMSPTGEGPMPGYWLPQGMMMPGPGASWEASSASAKAKAAQLGSRQAAPGDLVPQAATLTPGMPSAALVAAAGAPPQDPHSANRERASNALLQAQQIQAIGAQLEAAKSLAGQVPSSGQRQPLRDDAETRKWLTSSSAAHVFGQLAKQVPFRPGPSRAAPATGSQQVASPAHPQEMWLSLPLALDPGQPVELDPKLKGQLKDLLPFFQKFPKGNTQHASAAKLSAGIKDQVRKDMQIVSDDELMKLKRFSSWCERKNQAPGGVSIGAAAAV